MKFLKNLFFQKEDVEIDSFFQDHYDKVQVFIVKNFPIGSSFKYMGVDLHVVSHIDYWKSPDHSFLSIFPKVCCEYVNKEGEILKKEISAGLLYRIMNDGDYKEGGFFS